MSNTSRIQRKQKEIRLHYILFYILNILQRRIIHNQNSCSRACRLHLRLNSFFFIIYTSIRYSHNACTKLQTILQIRTFKLLTHINTHKKYITHTQCIFTSNTMSLNASKILIMAIYIVYEIVKHARSSSAKYKRNMSG